MCLHDHLLLAQDWANPFVSVTIFRSMVPSIKRWLSRTPAPFTTALFTASSPRPHTPPPTLPPPAILTSMPSVFVLPLPPCLNFSASYPPPPMTPPIPPLPSAMLEDDDDKDDNIEITGVRLALEDVMVECELDEDKDSIMLW
ncbi:hypothetical protein PM082_023646 [Marasmius tenuissimus]|nr:hypothetical protein PM082_023646 [Marasmius tenuissimus]